MDACTYESITGLKNYYGFKSLLKNGFRTQLYGCDDDTIVFNRVQSTELVGPLTLPFNQVGVILNASSDWDLNFLPNFAFPGSFFYQDVNGRFLQFRGNDNIAGLVFTSYIDAIGTSGGPNTLVYALFDLY